MLNPTPKQVANPQENDTIKRHLFRVCNLSVKKSTKFPRKTSQCDIDPMQSHNSSPTPPGLFSDQLFLILWFFLSFLKDLKQVTVIFYLIGSFYCTRCDNFVCLCFFLSDYNEDSKKPAPYLILGAKALSEALKNWTRKREVQTLFLKS